jgi:hypothetical protein
MTATKTKAIETAAREPDTQDRARSDGSAVAYGEAFASPLNGWVGIQRAAGNLAVQRHLSAATLQARLTVRSPDDACEQEADHAAEQVVQRKATPSEGRSPVAPPLVRQTLEAGGDPLPPRSRAIMEARFDADFGDVRVHADDRAARSAQAVGAQAYTVGRNIVFGTGRYAPETGGGQRLLAHELTHVAQQRSATLPSEIPIGPSGDAMEQEAERNAAQFVGGVPIVAGRAVAAVARLQRSEEVDNLISSYTHYLNLDEEALGKALRQYALDGRPDFVQNVLDALGSSDRDDVSYEMTHACTEDELGTIGNTDRGRLLLDRLYDELTSGSVSSEEQEEANRILRVKANRIAPEDFEAGMRNAKIFPFRLPGLTVISDAPLFAERRAGGKVWVRMPVRVLGTDEFRGETSTLPTETFLSGLELPENEIVGVKLYDEGGTVVYRPAIYLVELANNTDTTVATKVGEAAFIGLTLGGGSLFAGAGEAGWAARAVLWADRAAFALSLLTSIIREHRGWIIERFGDRGRTFLTWNDRVSSVIAIYGIGRAAVGFGQTINSFRQAYNDWKAFQAAMQLAEDEAATSRSIVSNTDDLLQNLDNFRTPTPANDNALPGNVVPIRSAATPASGGGATNVGGVSGNLALAPSPVVTPAVTPVTSPVALAPPLTTPTPVPLTVPSPLDVPATLPQPTPVTPLNPSIPTLGAPSGSTATANVPSNAPATSPAPGTQPGQASPGPFPIFWPSLLPVNGLNGLPIVTVGMRTIRNSNPRGTSVNTSEQIRVRQNVIRANPAQYPPGQYEAHHVLPLFINGLDVFPNVVPWPQANHQAQHWRLQLQPQLAGQVWQQPGGVPIVLGPYLYTFFGTPGHPIGTPYIVAGFK